MVTETDGLDEISESSKEGQSKIDQLEGRVNAFDLDARIFTECTVSTETAYTWSNYMKGSQSRIMCQCPHCYGWVSPEREHFVGWDNAETEFEAAERSAFSCPDCGILLSEDDRREMNLGAKLVHKGQEITPDGQVIGEQPKTDTLGFRWSAFNNLLTSCRMLGMEEWRAQNAENPIAAEVTVKQQRYAMPAQGVQVEQVPLSIAIVRGTAPGYQGRLNGRDLWEVPDWTDCITAHVDVGMRLLNWSVSAHGFDKRRDIIAYGTTATEQPDVLGPEEAIVQGLHRVRSLLEQNTDLDCVLVDCGYQGNKKQKNPRKAVYEFVLSAGDAWRAAMGLSSYIRKDESEAVQPSLTGEPWYFSRQLYLGAEIWVWTLTPILKHRSHGSYMIQPVIDDERQPGSVCLFGNNGKQHNEFATQLNNERYEMDHETGRSAWKRHGHNHYFDTDVGNLVAKSVVDSLEQVQTAGGGQAQERQSFTTPDGRAFFAGSR